VIGAAKLLRRSKGAVPHRAVRAKRDRHLTVSTLGSERDHQSVAFPEGWTPSWLHAECQRPRPSDSNSYWY
jgi:hypothetical protein